MELLKGAEVSAKMKEQAAQMLEQLGGNVPKLAIVRVGERPDDMSYERGATKKMESFGLRVQSYVFPEDIGHQEFKEAFININQDEDVTGILLLRPLPKQIHEADIERDIAFQYCKGICRGRHGICPMYGGSRHRSPEGQRDCHKRETRDHCGAQHGGWTPPVHADA